MVGAGIDCQSNCQECSKLCSFSKLFLQNLSQTLKKPYVKYFVNSKQGIFQIQCKISRNLWLTSEENCISTSPAWRQVHLGGHYKPPPCTTLSPCCGLQQSPTLSLCQLVTDFNQSTLCHIVLPSSLAHLLLEASKPPKASGSGNLAPPCHNKQENKAHPLPPC